jgi:hypothetical protein
MSVTSQNLSSKQILEAVKGLPNKEFEKFVKKILVIRANSQTKNSHSHETEILKKIYRKFSAEKLSQMRFLKEKRQIEELNEAEFSELASLTDSLEEFHANRMKNVVKLAKMRGLSLEETLQQLGISLPDYD